MVATKRKIEAYEVSFKSEYTKGKWLKNRWLYTSMRKARSLAKYIENQHDPSGKLVKTQTKIKKVPVGKRAVV